MRALQIAATGMAAQQLNVDVISNNIANLSTTSYKTQRAEFKDLMYQNQVRVGSVSSAEGTVIPSGMQVGLGVKAGSIYRIDTQGAFQETGNDLDLAISNDGYFIIDLPDGSTAYTRAGAFQTNGEGEIVTSEGYTVQPGITIPQDTIDIDINEDGEVIVAISGQIERQNLGRLELAKFINPAGLEAIGNNMFLETPASGDATTGNPGDEGFGTIEQEFLELSNVDSVAEITRLITAQRAYELNSRIISTSDEMLQAVSQLK